MKNENQNILLIGAAIILYMLLKKKPITARRNDQGNGGLNNTGLLNNITPMQKARIKANVEKAVNSINIEPIAEEMEDFKKQYYQDINDCKI